jgi:hypothetical protein
MQIALTLQELAQILEAHWGIEVQPENLTLSPDAGEIVIKDASFKMLLQGADKPATPAASRSKAALPPRELLVAPAPTVATTDDDDDFGEDEENTPLTMEDILNISKTAMVNKKVLTHPEISRALRNSYETDEPPEMDEAELAANRR